MSVSVTRTKGNDHSREIQAGKWTDRQTDRHSDRQAGRQAGRQTGRQAGRQADRQIPRSKLRQMTSDSITAITDTYANRDR